MVSDYPPVVTPAITDELLVEQSGVYKALALLALQGHILKSGSDTFAGAGTAKTIALPRVVTSAANYQVFITPTASDGMIGEVYVSKGVNNFSVYNSGISTGTFDWMVLYHNG